MPIGLIDIASAVGYAAALALIAVALVRSRGGLPRSPAWLGMGAMLVLMLVSIGNALNNFGIWTTPHASEEYIEVLFLPLIVYFMYAMHAQSARSRVAREHEVVERLDGRLNSAMSEVGEFRMDILRALSAAVDARDHYTALHSMHVADYSCAIGYRLGMKREIPLLEQAGLLHDIGKIGVPDHILLKPARLDDEEYEAIKRHVLESASIIGAAPFLAGVVPIVRHHHERWDGTGYPDGLAGEEIPLASRILAAADAFDAMTTNRPYRPAMDASHARQLMLGGSGQQFDPAVVDMLVLLLDEGVLVVQDAAAVA